MICAGGRPARRTIMTISEKIIGFVRNLFDTALFFAVQAVKEDFRNYVARAGAIDPAPSGGILLLANGPSLADDLPSIIERGEHLSNDVLAVNYFACDERFEIVRPKYYVLSDPTFFRRRCDWERVERLYATLNEKVRWPMKLYVQYYNPDRFDYRKALPNANIDIVPFHSQVYRGFPSLEYPCYRHGLGSGNFGSVIQNGEFIAILLGYKTLHLYGVDHTFFDGLTVTADNELCLRTGYFYDAEPQLKRVVLTAAEPPKPLTMYEYLADKCELFRGHEVLARYAEACGVEIINHTKNSLIDSYPRE